MGLGAYVPEQQTARTVFVWPGINACFPAVLYLFLSAVDLDCSLIAFRFGVAEGNPFMAWLVAHGLFIPGKLALSIVVAGLMAIIYNTPGRFRWIVWTGVSLMIALDMYHLWALPHLLGSTRLASVL